MIGKVTVRLPTTWPNLSRVQTVCGPAHDLPLDSAWMVTQLFCASVIHHLHDVARAEFLYRLLRPFPGQFSIAGGFTVGCVAHYLGLLATTLGSLHEAEEHFVQAESTHARVGAPTWLARTRLEWARMLLSREQRGDADRARELLGQALSTARDLGLAKVERDGVALVGECP